MESVPVNNYKKAFEEFNKALDYITNNLAELEKNPGRLAKIKANFIEKFEKPLDAAWDALTKKDKNRFATIYVKMRKDRNTETTELHQALIDYHGQKIIDIGEFK